MESGPRCVVTVQCSIIVSPTDALVSLILDPQHKSCQLGQRLSRITQEMESEFDVVMVGGVCVWVAVRFPAVAVT